MDRRTFARTALVGFGLAASTSSASAAAEHQDDANILFSAASPGHWGAGVAAKHVPQVSVANGLVSVTTPHPQSDAHFIVSHTVVLAHGVYLGRKTFTPRDAPVSEFKLPDGYAGPVIVTSTCNLHDIWTATVAA